VFVHFAVRFVTLIFATVAMYVDDTDALLLQVGYLFIAFSPDIHISDITTDSYTI